MADFLDGEMLDQLRRANPVPLDDVVGAAHEPHAVAIFTAIVSGELAVPSWLERRAPARRRLRRESSDVIGDLRQANPYPRGAVAGAFQSLRAAMVFQSITSGERDVARRLRPRFGASKEGFGAESPIDLLGVLRSINPHPQREVAGAGASMRAERLFDSIVTGDVTARLPWWRRRRVLIPAIGALAIASAAAGYALSSAPVTTSGLANCYASASLQSTEAFVSTGGTSPLAACQAVWQQGTFGGSQIPPLVECVLSNGYIGVFPGDSPSVCASLNLPVALSPTPSAKAAEELTNDLNSKLNATTCVAKEAAISIVDSDLDRFGFTLWTVTVQSSPQATNTCATAYVLPRFKLVTIEFIPPLATPSS